MFIQKPVIAMFAQLFLIYNVVPIKLCNTMTTFKLNYNNISNILQISSMLPFCSTVLWGSLYALKTSFRFCRVTVV